MPSLQGKVLCLDKHFEHFEYVSSMVKRQRPGYERYKRRLAKEQPGQFPPGHWVLLIIGEE